jgi:rod shape-determining protein MreC
MESFFVRYRNLVVLLAVLLAQIVGLAVQVRHSAGGRNSFDSRDTAGVRLIRLWADALVMPPERFFHASKLGAASLWGNYLDLRGVRQQNRDLQQTIDRLRLEQAALLEDAKQGERLQALAGFQQRYIYTTLAAQAIGSSGSDSSRVFYLDKGSADGLAREMPVITADGIVGKVREVYPHSAQVLAINDQTSGAGVILESTRVRGILRGDVSGQLLIVGILADQRIQPGEKVLTAGGDLIFPRGLPVGVVEKVVPDPDRDSFIYVIVKPAAHLDRLDEVLVITSTEPRFPASQQQDMATSGVLKGAEAAAIAEANEQRQKSSQIMAERLPGLTDPNAPAANPAATPAPGQTAQPGQASVAPPAPKLLPARHPDKFSPGAGSQPSPGGETGLPASQQNKPAAKPAPKAGLRSQPPVNSQPAHAGRNP